MKAYEADSLTPPFLTLTNSRKPRTGKPLTTNIAYRESPGHSTLNFDHHAMVKTQTGVKSRQASLGKSEQFWLKTGEKAASWLIAVKQFISGQR